jgi:hypothetical protein
VPPLEEAGRLARRNGEMLAATGAMILGRPLAEVRALGRRELIEMARSYLAPLATRGADATPLASDVEGPLFLAGHQPELFHPGVWVKNFALAGFVRRHGGLAVNLIVDNDTLKSTSLRIPVRSAPWPRLRRLPFDRWQGEIPWEARQVVESDTFARFGDVAADLVRPWGFEPLITTVWPDVLRHAGTRPIGEAFAAARRALERRWGCDNLEVPLSLVSQGEGFAWFAGFVLGDLPRFAGLYNAVVAAYRARRRIRSRNHPVPSLAAQGDWLEAPLWGWRAGARRRSRLFVRSAGDRLHLRAGEADWPDLPAPAAGQRFVHAWRGLVQQGYKVRPRALATTLFARVFLADLFVHGIGGGIYDELTDELMRRLFGIEPPSFLILSGTRRLPLPVYPVSEDDRRWLARQVRDIYYNPQRHLSQEEKQRLADVLRERQEWVQQQPDSRAGHRLRFQTIRKLNEGLRASLGDRMRQMDLELEQMDRELAANALLQRRDYSFCLYPEETLRSFVTAAAAV